MFAGFKNAANTSYTELYSVFLHISGVFMALGGRFLWGQAEVPPSSINFLEYKTPALTESLFLRGV